MKTVQLSGSVRSNVGKKDAKAVRAAGNVPCVLYGSGEQTSFSVKGTDLEKIIFSADVYNVELDIDGKKVNAIIQEKQMHPVKDTAMHVDFLELNDKKEVKVNIPVTTSGRSKGVLNGGRLQQVFRTLRVQGLPNAIPEVIDLDITPLTIGKAIRVGEVKIEGCKVLDPASAVVVSVKMSRGAVKDEEEEEAEGAEGAEGAEAAAE